MPTQERILRVTCSKEKSDTLPIHFKTTCMYAQETSRRDPREVINYAMHVIHNAHLSSAHASRKKLSRLSIYLKEIFSHIVTLSLSLLLFVTLSLSLLLFDILIFPQIEETSTIA